MKSPDEQHESNPAFTPQNQVNVTAEELKRLGLTGLFDVREKLSTHPDFPDAIEIMILGTGQDADSLYFQFVVSPETGNVYLLRWPGPQTLDTVKCLIRSELIDREEIKILLK